MAEKIRLRYAPSPTGFFHIGGLRSALFCYLYAMHYKRKGHDSEYIFRIEDTDIDRHNEDGIKAQTIGQEWVGIHPKYSDPKWWSVEVEQQTDKNGHKLSYRQTEKIEEYAKIANKLVEMNLAYYDFHTAEELDQMREEKEKNKETPRFHLSITEIAAHYEWAKQNNRENYVIRLKMNDEQVFKWKDLVRGEMSVPSSSLTDPVLIRSNKVPMYNFAVVVDDYMMEISHVFRGEEHLSNTPYQIAIREAIEPILLEMTYNKVAEPVYGHLPIVIGSDGKKLSKRDKTLRQFIVGEKGEDYMSLGYYPDAIRNFVALLGWSPADNKEILSMNELIERFDGSRINKAPAFFDIKKMAWISGEYFKKMSDEDFLKFAKPFVKVNLDFTKFADLVILTFKNYITYADELNQLITTNFIDKDYSILEEVLKNNEITTEEFNLCIQTFKDVLGDYCEITVDNTNEIITKTKEKSGLKGKKLFIPIRFLAIAKEHGPEMNKILPIVGKTNLLNIKI